MAERHYDLCECGRKKKKTSANCRPCSDRKRFRPIAPPGGDWWSDGERYGVLCISGYSDKVLSFDRYSRLGSRFTFSFWVVDLDEMGREIKHFKGAGKTIDDPRVRLARGRAIHEARRLNAIEAMELVA